MPDESKEVCFAVSTVTGEDVAIWANQHSLFSGLVDVIPVTKAWSMTKTGLTAQAQSHGGIDVSPCLCVSLVKQVVRKKSQVLNEFRGVTLR
jgi:hypothetical protein